MALVRWFAAMYTGADGKPSHSRFILTITILTALSWVSFIVFKTVALPELTGLGVFLGAVGTVTYGFSLGGNIANTLASKPSGAPTTTTVTTPETITEVKPT